MATPFLVTRADDPDWRPVVRNLDRRLVREIDYDSEIGAAWDEAWIWGGTAPDGWHSGVGMFRCEHDGWSLARVYIEPRARRRGYLREAWPLWRERYGDFTVDQPSDAMQAFLSRVHYAPGPPLVPGLRSSYWGPGSAPVVEAPVYKACTKPSASDGPEPKRGLPARPPGSAAGSSSPASPTAGRP